jgi:hypothetical protein
MIIWTFEGWDTKREELRQKIFNRSDLLESEFNVRSNHEFHKISDEVITETGLPISEKVFPKWQEWLNLEVRKRSI